MGSGARLLVVDDDQIVRSVFASLLPNEGYVADVAPDAEAALKLLSQNPYDLVISDIVLPGMDGITAMKQLKADPNTKSIPIIAITASAMTHNRTTMLAEGFDGYQTKPISLKDFLGEVERVLKVSRK